MTPAPEVRSEPRDDHVYAPLLVRRDSLAEFIAALQEYWTELSAEIDRLRSDRTARLAFQGEHQHPAEAHRDEVATLVGYLRQEAAPRTPSARHRHGTFALLTLSHGNVRMMKAAQLRHVSHLRHERERLADRLPVLHAGVASVRRG